MKSENLIIKKLEKLERKIKSKDKPPLWLNIDQLSDYINLSKTSIRKMVKQDQIPHTRAGNTNKLLFNRRRIDLWLLTKSKSPNKRQRKLMKDFTYEGK